MQIIEQIKKQSNGFFIHLMLILVGIGLSIFILTDDYRTPSDGYIIVIVFLSLILTMIGSFVWGAFNKLTIPLLVTLFIILPLSTFIADSTMVYSDDCTQISKINSDISMLECINFVIDNPDSTGMQVIEAFEQEKEIETDIDTTILNRQFNP